MSKDSRSVTESLKLKFKNGACGLFALFAAGVVGGVAPSWYSDRNSMWDAYVKKIDNDTRATQAAYDEAANLINKRWDALNRMADAIQKSTGGEELEAARKLYFEADRDWAINFTRIESNIQFNVDDVFTVGTSPDEENSTMKKVWGMPCTKIERDGEWDEVYRKSSGRVMMEVVNHCLGVAKTNLDVAMSQKAVAPAKQESTRREDSVQDTREMLDGVYWTHYTLRCIVLERELALRPIALSETYWNKFFGSLPKEYDPVPDNRKCLATWAEHRFASRDVV